jgi:DNA-binding MarR family transcriptional regulator
MWRKENSLGFVLNRTARAMKRTLDAKLTGHGITATQFIVIAQLWSEDGISITELGEHLDLDNPTLTGIVDRMERDGLLKRQRDNSDRRIINVCLTTKGKKLEEEIGHLADVTDAEGWNGFSVMQKKEFIEHLNAIRKKIDEHFD